MRKIAGVVVELLIPTQMTGRSRVSLYFHIPFCTKKCSYCHFYVIPFKENFVSLFMRSLELEWMQKAPLLEGKTVVSVYFGGGTPALLPARELEKILSWVQPYYSGDEITIEANPENLTKEKASLFYSLGINRLSVGVQTFEDSLLIKLGRTHTANRSMDAILGAAACGIKNISIDLMYDLPQQSLFSWENSLKRALTLPVSHISLYNLTIEPHTSFYKHRERIRQEQPKEQVSAAMYQIARQQFTAAGFFQYEISAFCLPNLESIHNSGYWTGRPFLGLGPSAYSYWDRARFRNWANLNRYAQAVECHQSPEDFRECLPDEERKRERLAIELRLLKGVDLMLFKEKEGALSKETEESIRKLIDLNLLKKSATLLQLTEKGVLFYDSVAEELI